MKRRTIGKDNNIYGYESACRMKEDKTFKHEDRHEKFVLCVCVRARGRSKFRPSVKEGNE